MSKNLHTPEKLTLHTTPGNWFPTLEAECKTKPASRAESEKFNQTDCLEELQ